MIFPSFFILLSACDGTRDEKDPAQLDAPLTTNAEDPVLREALEAPLASDPHLQADSNRDAIRPSDKALSGAVPARLPPRDAKAEALRLAGGKFIATPPADKSITSVGGVPVTLVAIADSVMTKNRPNGPRCDPRNIGYAMDWAQMMAPAFPLFPGAHLVEAAGDGESGPCAVRAARFRTPVSRADVMDFYSSMAKRAGFSLSHSEENSIPVLSGAKDNGASLYFMRFHAMERQGTDVELITAGGI